MNDDEIFTLIIQAKDEAAAVMAQVQASIQRMGISMQQANIIAGQSFSQLNQQTQMMQQSMASAAAATQASTARAAAAAQAHAAAIAAAAAAASNHASSLSTAAANVGKSFNAVESDLTALRGTMLNAAMLTAPLVIAGGEALKFAGDYEAAINKIKGLTSASPADIALWNPAMVEMSKNGTKSATEYAEAMFFIASSNLHGADALHVLDEAGKASTGGLGKMNDVAQALVGTLNAYVPQAQRAAEATQYMDMLTQAVVVGHFDPATLAPSLSRVTPIASAAGVPLEDVLAAVATTTHIGGTVDQGTTGLRAILTTLMAPGAGSSKMLDSLGLGAAESGQRLREEGLQQYLTEIDRASLAQAGGDKDVQDAILKKLFPQARTALPVLLALTRSGGDIDSGGGDANFYKQAEDSIRNQSAGATDKANETALFGFNAQMAVLKNNVDAVGIAFGTVLLPTLTPFVHDLGPALVTVLTQFANDAIRVGSAIADIARGFGALANTVGISIDPLRVVEGLLVVMAAMAIASVSTAVIGLGVDIGVLLFQLGILGIGIAGAAGNFLLMAEAATVAAVRSAAAWLAAAGPITLIIAGLVAASAVFAIAWANDWGGIQEITGRVVGFIAEKISGLLDFLGSNPALSMFFNVPKDWREQWGGVVDAIGAMTKVPADAVGGMANTVGAAWDAAMAKVQQAKDALAQIQAGFGDLNGPDVLGNSDAKAKIDAAMKDLTDIQAQATAAGADTGTGSGPNPNAAAQEKTALEKDLLELKKQSLAVEGQLIGPQTILRDLGLQMTEAAKEQNKLADDKRLLDLDAADFNQNADLKRIDNKIKQDQENLAFTRSPAEAGALNADIERLKVQAHGIRAGMFGSQDTRVEAEIAQSGDQLNVKLAQNSIQSNIAAVNASIKELESRKRNLEDRTKIDEHQLAVDKAEAALNPPAPTIPITPRGSTSTVGGTQPDPDLNRHLGGSGTPANADPDLNRHLGGGGGATTVSRPVGAPIDASTGAANDAAWSRAQSSAAAGGNPVYITIHNPVMTNEQNIADVIAQATAVVRAGLEQALAASAPLPVPTYGGPF